MTCLKRDLTTLFTIAIQENFLLGVIGTPEFRNIAKI